MKSINILDEISDGKLYDIKDIVKADTCGCDGCSDCCHDVGELVVLTPFDIYEMVNYLGVEFDKLLGDKIELRQNNKILQVGNCPKEDLKDVKVENWIGIENYDENKRFILEWYKFIKALTFRLKFVRDEKEIEEINQILLDSFYRIKINEEESFYSVFLKELPNTKNRLGII